MSPDTHATGSNPVSVDASRSQGTLVIHPATGEVVGDRLGLERLGTEVIADVRVALAERVRELRAMLDVADAELVRRLQVAGRSTVTTGDYEVSLEARNESVWDAEALEDALHDLVERGVLQASEAVGVISREPTVSRSKANRLAKRLLGREREAIEQCRTWRQAGAKHIEVVRAINLFE